ncbi:MAG TPA: DNA-directed RNA polymerase subunit H [Candidatus Thalassarchaeaceae archaeon]|nr:DNA-directed RNA polymerase subunit H [Candidatus Thalassarchaeaceae archaeon]MDP7658465.1 DNA-directed RNA polymerase subunit H [Candidatus Thalassarchaeaceae archaeon]HJO42940.1 DNA-directed RNA polymerase subunit H [Candidatus Thalassarchaeaceae archaeon]
MAVKSSTKKRLIELGINEDHAHKLADDANMDAIKRMTVEEVSVKTGVAMSDSTLEHIMGIIREHNTSRRRSRSGRITISRKAMELMDIPQGDDRFNVLNHILVPHHELVDADDESAILAPWGLEEADDYGGTRVAKELLPKILITDPAVQAIKEKIEAEADDLPAGWLTNRIVKIIRYSRAAGSSTAFRLIVESA